MIETDNSYRNGNAYLCGVDEAGRGPLAGPVVAAAVIFPDDIFIEGVYDSKKLSPGKREKLYYALTENAICYSVGISNNDEIDKHNILEATRIAMTRAVSKLRFKPSMILADGNFYKHKTISVTNIIHGDQKSFSIAAASIIAKVTRDRMMAEHEKEYPFFSFSSHKGYGTRKHVDEILEYGFSKLHRRSFQVKRLKGLFNETR
jgi:ribonuclease HII